MMDSDDEQAMKVQLNETPPVMYSQHHSQVAAEVKRLAPYIQPPVSNPAPLGLFAFAITTALLQVEHAKLAGNNSSQDLQGVTNLVWGFAIFYGGLLQVLAGLGEYQRNNSLGYTAFLSYGGFWMSLGLSHIVIGLSPNESITAAGINLQATQAMLVMFGLLTCVFWICSFAVNATICLLFFLLMTLFFLLAGGTVNETCDIAAGYVGFATSLNAFWLASAEMINDILGKGKPIIPLGQFRRNLFKFAELTQNAALSSSELVTENTRSKLALARLRDALRTTGKSSLTKVSNADEEAQVTN